MTEPMQPSHHLPQHNTFQQSTDAGPAGNDALPSGQLLRSAEFREAGHWGDDTLPEVIDRCADDDPARPYVSDGTRSLTYGEFRDQAWTLAANLVGLGVRPGDRVAVQLPNWTEFVLAYAACARLGAITIPIGSIYRKDEIEFIIENSGAIALIACGEFGGFDHTAMITEIVATAGHPLTHIVVRGNPPDGALAFTDLLVPDPAHQDLPEPPSADDPHLILYTSGTESRPKGCLHTWNTCSILAKKAIPSMALTSDDAMLMVSPVTHGLGLTLGIMAPALVGGSVHLLDIFDPATALERLAEYHCTGTASTAPFIQMVLDAYDPDVHDVSRLRFWFTGGATIPTPLVEAAARQFSGCRVVGAYGSSETMLATVSKPDDPVERVANTDGYPVPGVEIRIVTDGETAPAGVDGEIRYRGPGLILGYWGRPDLTADATDDEGWWCTGDLGHLDDRGYLRVTGRIKDIIIRAGYNISAREVEEALLPLPGIARIEVVGIADRVVGERVCAVIEPATGHEPPTLEEIRDHLLNTRHMAVWKVPEQLEIVTEWPVTGTGKVQKYRLRQAISAAAPAVASGPVGGDADRTSKLDARTRSEQVLALVSEEAAAALGLRSVNEVRPDQRLGELGLESLKALELRNRIGDRMGAQLPVSLLFDHPTPHAITRYLLDNVLNPAAASAPRTGPTTTRSPDEPIAVVSMACRLPGGVADPDQLWRLLADGGDAIGPFPTDRWDVEELYDPDPDARGHSSAREGGFLPRIDTFDARMFGITPREATSMDPQQRLLLETAWEVLERAGIVPETLAGSTTGVYVGTMAGDYLDGASLQQIDGYFSTGSALSVASGRLAYTFGLVGPAVTVDSACSSSLLAVHLAAAGLRAGECDAALVGGVTVMTTPRTFVEFSRLRGLSPSGRCRAFSDDADGTGFAEGVVMIVLKRLADAQRDGDEVLAVLRGTAANQDGRSQGLTVPYGPSQQEVIRLALERSALAAADIDYVEAHGTGTVLGDPIEANALSRVFGPTRPPGRPLRLGSLKSNIGHTQAAAGLAGLIKVVLSLRNGELPPTLHADRPTEHVDWIDSGLQLVRERTPWHRGTRPRRAGVSAFGVSGTNVHLVVEEAPPMPRPEPERPRGDSSHLFLVSARDEAALRRQAARLAAHVADRPTLVLPDLARTLARHRTHLGHRAAVIAHDRDELLSGLDALAAGRSATGLVLPPAHGPITGKVAFVVPGHSPRWAGMGAELLSESDVFSDAFARYDEALRVHTGWSVTDVLTNTEAAVDTDRVEVIHSALLALDCALAELWRSYGVAPDGVIGHSLGEVAAARIAGALSPEKAAALAVARGLALRTVEGMGGALSVELSVEAAEQRLAAFGDQLTVAAINSSRSTTVSGDLDALATLQERLVADGIAVRRVPVPFASHSHHMDPVADDLRQRVESIAGEPSEIPMYSTVLGELVPGTSLDAGYWARNVREQVRFADTVRRMIDDGFRYFVELSPHPTLAGSIKAVAADAGVDVVTVGSLRRDQGGVDVVLSHLAQLTGAGYNPDWSKAFPAGEKVTLPTYAFERDRFWSEPAARNAGAQVGTPFVQTHVEDCDVPGRHVVQAEIDLRDSRFGALADHRVSGEVWLPGAAYLEMALEASGLVGRAQELEVADVRFEQPLTLSLDRPTALQMVIAPANPDSGHAFTIASRSSSDSSWTRHVTGRLTPTTQVDATESLSAVRTQCAEDVDIPGFYTRIHAAGIEYGPRFRLLQAGWRNGRAAIGQLADVPTPSGGLFDPALLDAALQVVALPGDIPPDRTFVPAAVDRIRVGVAHARPVWATSAVRAVLDDRVVLDLRLFDAQERLVLALDGFEIVALSQQNAWLYEVRWKTRPLADGPATRGSWLILADDSGIAEQLSQRLGTVPHVIARRGPTFAAEGAQRFCIDPSEPAHFERLLTEAFDSTPPERIIVLSALDARQIDSADTSAEAALLGCTTPMHLVRAVTGRAWNPAPRLFLITRGSQAVRGSSAVTHPEQALAWGFGTAIGQEHPELRTTLIDLPEEGALDALWNQLRHADDEPWVALHDDGRWVPRLVRARPDDDVEMRLLEDRTFLVTGGMGGLGRVAADRLASLGARHVALLGRSVPTGAFSEWLSEMEARGVSVYVLRADVSERDSLAAALVSLRRAAPPVGGVVHAAGVLDDALMASLTPERTARVLAPKVLGTVLLTELIPEAGFFVLFSSAAGLLGSAGQSAYSAANAFLDAWAHHLAGAGRSALSLDWGAWSGVGMVAESADRAANVRRMGLIGFSAEQGGDIFARVLGSNRRQLAPIMLDATELGRRPETAATRPMLADLAVQIEAPAGPRELVHRIQAATSSDERRSLIEVYLRATVAKITASGTTDISVTTPLKELDLDSLMRVTLNNTITRDLGVAPPSRDALTARDISALADTVLSAMPEHTVTEQATPPSEPDEDDVPLLVRRPATRDVIRLLRTAQRGTPAAAHAIGFAVRLVEPTTPERLTAILAGFAARHAALRTAIVLDAEHGAQLETRREPDGALLTWSTVEDDVDVEERLHTLLEQPFDLARSPLWRFEMLESVSGRQVLIYCAHHAVSDAASLLLVMAELGTELSGARLDQVTSNRDIERLLRAQAPTGNGPLSADWRADFTGCRRLDLTLASPRPTTRSYRAGGVTVDLPQQLQHQVTTYATRQAVTPAAVYLGTLTVLLARLRRQTRFVLAVPVDTRVHADALGALGYFGVPIPFPAEVVPEETVADVLRRTDERLTRVLQQGVSFVDAMAALVQEGLHRDSAPLVEVYFNYIRLPGHPPAELELLRVGPGWSDLDLMVTVVPDLGQLWLDYNLDIIDAPSCAEFGRDYLDVLTEVVDDSAGAEPALRARRDTVALAATFALGHLPAMLGTALDQGAAVAEAPYHQVLAGLHDPAGVFAREIGAGVVLLRAADLARFGPVTDELLAELAEEYPVALRAVVERTGAPLVVGLLPAEARDDRLHLWERQLADRLEQQPGIAVLRSADWFRDHSVDDVFDAETDAAAHLPFGLRFQAVVSITLADVLGALRRPAPKVIVVDGDETLWSGVAGEVGPDGVDLSGHRSTLARRLLSWREAGVLLVLASSNDESTVLEVLARPESLLRAEHFTIIAAGWEPKAHRIRVAALELGLGLNTFLFLDDNPVEIAAVRSALPEVLCVTCPPVDELDAFLRRLWPAAPRRVTSEDASRAEFYRVERIRAEERQRSGFVEFLERLALEVDIRPLSPDTVTRSVQLGRRTNQFNLRPAEITDATVDRWQRSGEVWTATVRDRFGDYGQVGLLALRTEGDQLEVVTWMLSCRALGRGVEEHLLQWLADRADDLGCSAVRLIADRTPRNVPARRLVAALGEADVEAQRLDILVTPDRLRSWRSWENGVAEMEGIHPN